MNLAVVTCGLIGLLLLGLQPASANDVWVPVQVYGCNGVPAKQKYIAITGCTDSRKKDPSGGVPPSGPTDIANSVIYGKTDDTGKVTVAYRFRRIDNQDDPLFPGTFSRNDPNLAGGGCQGVFGEFLFGSASNPCYITVLSTTSSDPLNLDQAIAQDPPFTIDTTYNQVQLFPDTNPTTGVTSYTSLSQYASFYLSTHPATNEICYNPQAPQTFTPRSGNCNPTCPNCPITPPAVNPLNAAGNTAYAVLCQLFPTYNDYSNYPTSTPFAISFRSNQPVYASSRPVGFNNWGWEIFWPKSTIPETEPCEVTGRLYAGQSNLVGTLTATIIDSGSNYVLSFTYDVSASGNTLKEIHVYFSGLLMTTNAPGRFGTKATGINSATYSATTSIPKSSCPSRDKYLYLAFHAALA